MLQYFFSYRTEIPETYKGKLLSAEHLMSLLVLLIFWVVLTLIFRHKTQERRQRFLTFLCFSLPVLELMRTAWFIGNGHFTLGDSLPLHLCGLMCFIMPVMAVTQRPLLKEYAFAVGFMPALIALITPDVWDYPAISFQYMQSMAVHGIIAFIPLYMVFVMGFKPDIRRLPKVVGMVFLFALAMVPINLLTSGNYFFLFKAPPATPIDIFYKMVGWPWYILPTFLLGCILWGLCYLPFEIGRLLVRIRTKARIIPKGTDDEQNEKRCC